VANKQYREFERHPCIETLAIGNNLDTELVFPEMVYMTSPEKEYVRE